MEQPATLKTFTLNCWTVPLSSRDIEVRVHAIGQFLASSDYDIVFLQEVWTRDSYEKINLECGSRFPFSRCFFSGRIGTSGLCVFSRYPIVDSFYHPFLLNGFWYAVTHGDNHVCKGAGFVRIMIAGLTVNCFITHLHAEYERKNDQYFAHRVAQAYELLKFASLIAPRSSSTSLVIIAGDLNLEPQDLGVALLKDGGFRDAWKEIHGDNLGATCDLPQNCYTPKESSALWPAGRRIDYILYRPENVDCVVIESAVLCKKLPDNKPLSDHEAVTATFKLGSLLPLTPSPRDLELDESDVLQQAHQVFLNATKECAQSCWHWLYACIAVFLLGLAFLIFAPHLVNCITTPIFAILLVVLIGHYFLVKRQEHIHLIEMAHQVECDLKARKVSGSSSKC